MKIINSAVSVPLAALLLAWAGAALGQGEENGAGQWMDMSGDLDAWMQTGDANWRIEEGAFVADSGSGMLVTEEEYGDFQIQLEFWVDEPANSGVFLRAGDPQDIRDTTAYEVNIYDTRPDQTYRTGGIVNFAAPNVSINTGGRWNTYDIIADGNTFRVTLNGVTTVVYQDEDETYEAGYIGLQYGAGTVKFRNVRIREL